MNINDNIIKNDVDAENQTHEKVKIVEHENNSAKRILFLGNSITLHETKPQIGWNANWGMAASSQEKDYVHIVLNALRERYSEISYAIVNVGEWELNYWKDDVIEKFKLARDFKADIIIFRFGENINLQHLEKHSLNFYLNNFMKYLNINAEKVIVTDTFWEHGYICNALKCLAKKNGYTFVVISDLGYNDENKALGLFENPSVAAHPGDLGMERIAQRIINKL